MSRSVGVTWMTLVGLILAAMPVAACDQGDAQPAQPVEEREIDIDIHVPAPVKTAKTVRPLAPVKPAPVTPTRRPRADEVYPPAAAPPVEAQAVEAAPLCVKCKPADPPSSGPWTPPAPAPTAPEFPPN